METTIEQRQLRWLGHVIRRDKKELVGQIFEAKKVGKRKRGRPRETWKEEVRVAAEKRGTRWKETKDLARNCGKTQLQYNSTPKGTRIPVTK